MVSKAERKGPSPHFYSQNSVKNNVNFDFFANSQIHFAMLAALALGLVIHRLGIKFADRIGVFSVPSARRRHGRPVPLSGGLWILLTFIFGVCAFLAINTNYIDLHLPSLWPLIIGMSALTILGHFDDRKILNIRDKFIAQIGICILAFAIPQVREFAEAFRPTFGLSIYPLMILFMGGIVNACNFIDGIDGLLGSMMLIFLLALLVREPALHANGNYVQITSLLLLPAVLSFLFFNWRPASIFMGDSGSMTLGYALIILCLSAGSGPLAQSWQGTPEEAVGGILQLGYPILDLLWVITKRLRAGFSPFRADQNHLHHHVMRLGFSSVSTVFILGLVNISFQIASYSLQSNSLLEALPQMALLASFSFIFMLWIISTDRLKSTRMSNQVHAPLAEIEDVSEIENIFPIHQFSLVVNVEPLFGGQHFNSDSQALTAIQSLGYLIESNCPKCTNLLWNSQGKTVFVAFPHNSVQPKDVEGLVNRIQKLIDVWVEMFNVSLSTASLKVSVTQGAPKGIPLRKIKSSDSQAA